MAQSMSRIGKCVDNGPMEGFWGNHKAGTLLREEVHQPEGLVKMIGDYITYYNTKRLQRGLGVRTTHSKHFTTFSKTQKNSWGGSAAPHHTCHPTPRGVNSLLIISLST